MSKVMRFYNPKTNQYEPINAGGVLDEDTKEILTGKDINKKADKRYVDNELDKKADKNYVNEKISNIDINQFEAIDKGGYSFNNLKKPGVYRLWNSSTSPCGSTTDYITVVFAYNDKVTQVAHSSTTNSYRENRVYTRYYSGSRWTGWRELTSADIEKEIDNLKTSGVEINRILVDALNSKNVSASTSSSIKVNARKVNDIKMGDYSIGDILAPDKIEELYFEYNTGYIIWALTRDSSDNIYCGGDDNKVTKLDSRGNKIWEYNTGDTVRALTRDSNDNIYYGGGDDNKVTKLDSRGNKIWEYYTGNWVRALTRDSNDNIYCGGNDNKVTKLDSRGNKIWEYNTGNTVRALTRDSNDNIYCGGNDNKVTKLDSKGNKKPMDYKIIG